MSKALSTFFIIDSCELGCARANTSTHACTLVRTHMHLHTGYKYNFECLSHLLIYYLIYLLIWFVVVFFIQTCISTQIFVCFVLRSIPFNGHLCGSDHSSSSSNKKGISFLPQDTHAYTHRVCYARVCLLCSSHSFDIYLSSIRLIESACSRSQPTCIFAWHGT